MLFGKGSSNAIDENKIYGHAQSKSELFGIINSDSRDFHSILYIQPASENYSVNADYRNILYGKANVTFFPVISGQISFEEDIVSVSNITLENILDISNEIEIKKYLNDLVERATLDRIIGVKRFYDNKSKFLRFP
jgi:hypothetical protein